MVLRRAAESPTKNDEYTCTINSDLNPFSKLIKVISSVWDSDDRSDIAYWNHSGGPAASDDDHVPVFECALPHPIRANNVSGTGTTEQYSIGVPGVVRSGIDSQVWFELLVSTCSCQNHSNR